MTDFTIHKRLAGQILKCSPQKIWLDPEGLDDIKESITKTDIKSLISKGVIAKRNTNRISRSRANVILTQKSKGLRKGHGSRRGTHNARDSAKRVWINKIRKQRGLLKTLKNKGLITVANFRLTMNRAKGGYFRSERHLKTHLVEHNLFIVKKKEN